MQARSRNLWVSMLVLSACGDGDTPTTGFTGLSGSASMTNPMGMTMTAPMTEATAPTSGEPAGTSETTAETTADVTAATGTTATPTTAGPETSESGSSEETAAPASCGDGVVQDGEACDDGNDDETDACLNSCEAAVCGDGVVQAGVEACDDGNAVDDDECTNACASPSCGDGQVQAPEACDDGNMVATDACTNMCTVAACGDGVVHAGVEMCDGAGEAADCDDDCTPVACGDGNVNAAAGEECDDGNVTPTDACTATCKTAKCGDGVVQAGVEACDDGNMIDNDMCKNNCTLGGCVPNGARAPLNNLGMDSASGCWSGNPCDNDNYSFDMGNGQNFQNFNEAIACSGTATCVGNVGIATYVAGPTCQGSWDVLCDNVMVGTIQTLPKACTGSAMGNGCSVAFAPRLCATITLRAAQDNDQTAGCCGGTQPDSMITAVSAW